MKALIEKLASQRTLTEGEFITLIEGQNERNARLLAEKAAEVRQESYGKDVYLRGLIEFTNYCKNDCYYCGMR